LGVIRWEGPRRRRLRYKGHGIIGRFCDNKLVFSEQPEREVEAERYADKSIAKSSETGGKECQK